MGILAGPITIRRYQVQGDLDKSFREDFINILQAGAFAGFEKNSDAEKAMGWATAQDALDVDIRDFKAFRNEYLLFSLRIDTRRVPSSALRLHIRKAEEEHLAKSKRPKLSRNEKKEIKDLVRKKLLQQVLPSTKSCDILWNVNTKRMDFWGTSDKLNAEFIELFEKCFSLRLRPLNPYTNAVALFPDLDDRVQGLMPSSIVHLDKENPEEPEAPAA